MWMNVCVEGVVCMDAGVAMKGLNKNSDNYIRVILFNLLLP